MKPSNRDHRRSLCNPERLDSDQLETAVHDEEHNNHSAHHIK